MSDGHAYRFETAAQLACCLRMNLSAHVRLEAESGAVVATLDAAPRWLGGSTWLDAAGTLRGETCGGPALGEVTRIVRSGRTLWALAGGSLLRIDAATLQVIDITAETALDIAGDGAGGLWLTDGTNLDHRDARCRSIGQLAVPAGMTPYRIAETGGTVVVLDTPRGELAVLRNSAPVLRLYPDEISGEPGASFTATDMISGDGSVLFPGAWGSTAGWLALDAQGDVTGSGVWDQAPEFVAPAGDAIIAAFAESGAWTLRSFSGALAPAGALLLTPMLESDTLAGAWGQTQVTATLPVDATLAIAFAATGDAALAASAATIFADEELTAGNRVRKLRAILPWSEQLTYTGLQLPIGQTLKPEPFAAPLGEAAGNLLWLAIEVHRNGGSAAPAIASLNVQHDVAGLMEFLPAIFRTPEGDGDGTLRRLVSVLEATFLGFDDKIGKLADRVDPGRTETRWLASLAALLGLPFDEALNSAQRRALLHAAAPIIAGRGTRAGVLALLTAVLGERPYRVIDRTEQSIPIALGAGRLPGFLAGPSARVPRLDARLVLGRTPMGAAEPCDGQVTRGPSLLVVIPSRGNEQRRLGEALQQMIAALVPAGVRLELRWTGFAEASGGAVLGVLEDWPVLSLNAGLTPGAARLGGMNEAQLREDGIALARRLD